MPSDSDVKKKPARRLVLVAVVLVALGVGLYYWYGLSYERPVSSAPPDAATTPASGTVAQPRHPVDAREAQDDAPLPPLDQSDAPLRARGEALVGVEPLERFFHLDNIARRVVVTIDNLSRSRVPQRYHLARPAPGRFVSFEDGERLFLDPENYERYTPYVELAEAVGTGKLVALYLRFYPLLQEEYENQGYTDAYFNDRVIAVIDDLLAAPEPDGPIRLVRPRVMYEFADPDLESLSAGQKIMIRMGPENAARIKEKLQEIRDALTSGR